MKEFFFFLGAAPIMTATHAATFSSTTLHEDQAKLTALDLRWNRLDAGHPVRAAVILADHDG